MNIRETFLKLTERTYPYGFEDALFCYLPEGTKQDVDGNYYYKIGESKTIFACHLDTACKAQVEVNHVFDLQYIKTDGKSILGADDKAGMTILLWMIKHNIPGLYYFFIGEEVGCIGSRAASVRKDFFSRYDRIISFDRRGTTSVITHQSSRRTCSDNFANALAIEINKSGLYLKPDDTGVYTDSAEFASVIPECTNISVGYNKEHTHTESQDIVYLERLCHAVLKVDFESLPVSRDPAKYEYKEYKWSGSYNSRGYGNGYGNGYCEGSFGYDDYYTSKKKRKRGRGRGKDSWQQEELDYGYRFQEQPDYYYVDGRKVYYNDKDFTKERPTTKDHYVMIRDMYLQGEITQEELEIIKNDFLTDSEEDKLFFDYMTHVI